MLEPDRVHLGFDSILTTLATLPSAARCQSVLPRCAHAELGLVGNHSGVKNGSTFISTKTDQGSPRKNDALDPWKKEGTVDTVVSIYPPKMASFGSANRSTKWFSEEILDHQGSQNSVFSPYPFRFGICNAQGDWSKLPTVQCEDPCSTSSF